MKRKLLSIIFLLAIATLPTIAQNNKVSISDNIDIIKLSDNVYLHISYLQTENWGKVGANGLLLVKDGEALMIDTPRNDGQTVELFNWPKDSLNVDVTTIIPTHWHEDCMGGLNYLQTKGVRAYANQKTIVIAKEKGLPISQYGFSDLLTINFQEIPVECYYFGGGHTTDVIVVWLPTEDILFAGDVIKDINSTNLGNVADADIEEWPMTLNRITEKFPTAKIVIPGHGNIGGIDLMEHTLELLHLNK